MIIVLLSLSIKAQQNNTFVIKGKLGNIQAPAKIYIAYTANGLGVEDSACIVNGEFLLTQKTPYPVRALLYINRKGINTHRVSNNNDLTDLYVEPKATITLVSDESLANAKFSGSTSQANYELYEKAVAKYDRSLRNLRKDTVTVRNGERGKVKLYGSLQDYCGKEKTCHETVCIGEP